MQVTAVHLEAAVGPRRNTQLLVTVVDEVLLVVHAGFQGARAGPTLHARSGAGRCARQAPTTRRARDTTALAYRTFFMSCLRTPEKAPSVPTKRSLVCVTVDLSDLGGGMRSCQRPTTCGRRSTSTPSFLHAQARRHEQRRRTGGRRLACRQSPSSRGGGQSGCARWEGPLRLTGAPR